MNENKHKKFRIQEKTKLQRRRRHDVKDGTERTHKMLMQNKNQNTTTIAYWKLSKTFFLTSDSNLMKNTKPSQRWWQKKRQRRRRTEHHWNINNSTSKYYYIESSYKEWMKWKEKNQKKIVKVTNNIRSGNHTQKLNTRKIYITFISSNRTAKDK